MSDNERRIIDYDAFNDLPPNSWLIVDSEGQGTGKIAPIKIGATYEIQDGAHSFTLVGSNGYTHTVDIPYDSVQMSYEDYQALTEVQKMDGTNRFVPDVPTDDLEPEIWQRVGRTPLTTVEKTISPAINELKDRIDDSDGEIADIKSNLTEYVTLRARGGVTKNSYVDYTLDDAYTKYKKVVFVIDGNGIYTPMEIYSFLITTAETRVNFYYNNTMVGTLNIKRVNDTKLSISMGNNDSITYAMTIYGVTV